MTIVDDHSSVSGAAVPGAAFVVRPTDGRILNTSEFLDLPPYGDPIATQAVPASRPAKRTRYKRTIENLRAARKEKLEAEKEAKKVATTSHKGGNLEGGTGGAFLAPDTANNIPKTGATSSLPSNGEDVTPSGLSWGGPNRNLSKPTGRQTPTGAQSSVRGKRRPRANFGASCEADEVRHDEVLASVTRFNDAFRARAAADAAQIRALAVAYDIALERALMSIAGGSTTPRKIRDIRFDTESEQRVFSWHLTSIVGEFAISTNESDATLRNRAGDARLLTTKLPDWLTALEQGKVDLRHVNTMLRHGRQLSEEHVAEYGAVTLEFAVGHTPGQTGTFAEEAAATIAAMAFEEAHARARQSRSVSYRHDGFGMARLDAYLPSELLAPAMQLLELGARELREIDAKAAAEHASEVKRAREQGLPEPEPFQPDTRTLPQMRADLLIETLLCSAPGESRVKTTVSVTVPAFSLLDAERMVEKTAKEAAAGDANKGGATTQCSGWRADGHGPALLNGTQPMSIEQARQFASDASFLERILIHPVTGQVTAVDKYEMSIGMRRFLEVRDRTCRFPGCVRPAQYCDADHTHPYSEDGPTDVDNLAHLCRAHHVQKHRKPWTVTNLGGGVLEWRTPLGQVATTSPIPHGPVFVPVGEYGPPPF
ncbi:HNH endonuclease signature motif containing protein [Gulosibacter chungangensis]|uniref:DUF222 domain-containing protein n=1 Tax=Gulosibacter chungangensis TaxID=979746 RepID=A0A7J5BA51_9MICO|nr:DUF222 domain-containing protein [Gulosibacter chungangensis]